MKKFKNTIIPNKPIYFGRKDELDYRAICIFMATGFFLDNDTYFLGQKTLKPAHICTLDNQNIIQEKPYFKWHYTPIERPLKEIVQEFAELFEQIIAEQIGNKNVILPLSGGLDSRTLAVALKHLNKNVTTYSYSFTNGLDENRYGKKIAEQCNFTFHDLRISEGYLWNKIEELAQINQCYSEFTHPRQMAFIDSYKTMGDVFSLGHWGDVLFDDMGVDDQLSFEEQVAIIIKKIVKKGGLELANTLWKSWNLEGNFETYLHRRVSELLQEINITESANAAIRAFKSSYWATRWTSTNLSVFEHVKPITVPYYDDRMCKFICSIPEKYLAGRQIQIEYIKLRNPKIAKIEWQGERPFNLYNYKYNTFPYNLPYRVFSKVKRLFNTKKFIQRNWELQFLGNENEQELKNYLFNNQHLNKLVNPDIVNDFYQKFKTKDNVFYSHPISMLLTLSLFLKNNKINK